MKSYLLDVQRQPALMSSQASLISIYLQFLRREKSIYTQLNKFQREGTLVYGFMWSPYPKHLFLENFYGPDEGLVAQPDSPNYARQYQIQVEEIETKHLQPPTFFRTNDFTAPF